MKSKYWITIAIFFSLILSGCYLKSIHPLVKPENSVEIQGLSGVWEDVQKKAAL